MHVNVQPSIWCTKGSCEARENRQAPEAPRLLASHGHGLAPSIACAWLCFGSVVFHLACLSCSCVSLNILAWYSGCPVGRRRRPVRLLAARKGGGAVRPARWCDVLCAMWFCLGTSKKSAHALRLEAYWQHAAPHLQGHPVLEQSPLNRIIPVELHGDDASSAELSAIQT